MSSSFDWRRISEKRGKCRPKRGARHPIVKGNNFGYLEDSRGCPNGMGSRFEQNPTRAPFNTIRGARSRSPGEIVEPPRKKGRRERLNHHPLKLDQPPARTFPIGLKHLRALLESDPSMIALELLNKNSGFDILLKDENLREEKLRLVLELLHKSVQCKTNSEGTLSLMLLTFSQPNFCKILMNLVSECKYETSRSFQVLSTIGDILSSFVKRAPSAAFPLIAALIDICMLATQVLKAEKPEQAEEPERVFNHLDTQRKVMRQQIPTNTQCGRMPESPGDFKSLSVTPTCKEISSNERPFLRPCLMNGGYRDSQHYLDVQFRLFKEDFVRPLRQGVNSFLNNSELTDIRVYQNVTVHGTKIEGSNFVYILNLSERKLFRRDSKQLMFGNVLCISPDNFETMLVATVACRDNLSQNLLGVKVETEPFTLYIDKNYTIIESKSYFVAYYHTLKALKEFDVVPFENYIVRVCESHSPPSYITDTTMFNLHSELKSLRLLSPISEWPTASDLMLDEPQFRALHAALTRQVAIIQGPPGTGKTFLGLKVAEILLRNREVWNEKFCSRPILVVCYTNHALDQFLEGISYFTRKIVRIGSRSKSELINAFQIKNYLRSRDSNLERGKVEFAYRKIVNELRDLKSCIANLTEMSKKLRDVGVLSLSSFHGKGIMPALVIKQLLPIHMLPIKSFLLNTVDKDKIKEIDHLVAYSEYFDLEDQMIIDNPTEVDDQIISDPLELEGEVTDDLSELEEGETIDDPIYVRKNLVDDVKVGSTACSNVNGFFDEVSFIYENDEEEYARLLDDMEDSLEQLEIESSSGWIKFEISEDDIKEKLHTERNLDIKMELLQELRFVRALSRMHVTKNDAIRIGAERNIWNLPLDERGRLYTLWLNQLEAHILKEKHEKEKEYRRVHRSLDACKELEYLTIMKDAHVVGMTTTAAAQYCKVLHDLGPPIVLIEEAAEIFEAHVITSLSSRCKHLIMIGDHQQLRPKPNVFELAKNFHLDTSLFERLINNGIKYEVLEHQHRMKPSFSKLLVPAIYPNLKDHPSVLNRPRIRGVAKDVFFVDHHVFEDKKRDELESFQNRHEAEFAMGLCRYLLLQGYETSDITIITPYSGQFLLLKRMQMERRFNCGGVRISILDNYQGEESNIIILSLVRSNKDGRIGFMKADNRVCVALSRAKLGMYIIGNMTQMARESPLWAKIKGKLMSVREIGCELKLTCDKHQEEMLVSCIEDFQLKSPNGGCRNICSSPFNKNCVHTCQDICHPSYYDHSLVECMQPCVEVCPFGHPCPLVCSRSCPPCTVRVEKELPCGHTHQVPCYVPPEDYKCTTIVSKPHPLCNHSVSVPCHRTEFTCREKCPVRLDCGHQCRRTCHQGDDPEHEYYKCRQPCEKKTPNCSLGHACPSLCFVDCGPCRRKIDKRLPCGHTVKGVECSLSLDQIKCSFPCTRTRQCGHKCEKKCKEECGQCMKKVEKNALGCGHKVKVPCHVTPDRWFCRRRCVLKLSCGHGCKKKCNEECLSERDCLEPTPTEQNCPKGHPLVLPCFMANSLSRKDISSGEKEPGEYCTKDCGTELECGHTCTGTCGQCLNGRFHLPCSKKCLKLLVCGHLCMYPCSSECPPCRELCSWKCNHSSCTKFCGLPCVPCKEKCTRGCRHKRCYGKCGTECTTKPCSLPCPKKLKCKHPCIGFCGEPCPKVCRICHKESVTEIFFGCEDDVDARFVMLEDCGHVFEATGIERWMTYSVSGEGNNSQVGMKKCPKCNRSIYNTRRFQTAILKAHQEVSRVKEKYYQFKFDIVPLIQDLKEIEPAFPYEIIRIRNSLGLNKYYFPKRTQTKLNSLQFSMYKFQLSFLKAAQQLPPSLREKNAGLKSLIKRVLSRTVRMSNQEKTEASCELRRIEFSSLVDKVRSYIPSKESLKSIVTKIEIIMDQVVPFDKAMEEKVKLLVKEAKTLIGGLGITNSERIEIVAAMGFKQGHWYACPNNHIYCIGDCGGATQIGRCPECSESIGGESHKVLSGNRLASEMDGASTSAWPHGV